MPDDAHGADMMHVTLSRKLVYGGDALTLAVQQEARRGELIALYGPSGAGKTSILRMLAGLARPDSGRIVVNGEVWFDAVAGIDLPPQRRSIGMVFQDYALFPNLSVRANIAYGAADDPVWIDELLALMQLTTRSSERPHQLSGGERQRVALARAVARRPALLLLDEPLAALDLNLRQQLQADLANLHRRLGCTTVLVSHDLGEVFRLADRVWRLEKGSIAQCDTPAAVFLQQRVAGKLALRAQVLAVRREEVVSIVSLLIGQEIIDIIAGDDEAALLRIGDSVILSAKTFGALRFDQSG